MHLLEARFSDRLSTFADRSSLHSLSGHCPQLMVVNRLIPCGGPTAITAWKVSAMSYRVSMNSREPVAYQTVPVAAAPALKVGSVLNLSRWSASPNFHFIGFRTLTNDLERFFQSISKCRHEARRGSAIDGAMIEAGRSGHDRCQAQLSIDFPRLLDSRPDAQDQSLW